ncbi:MULTISPECIES: c-type cytochrome biogenesis protein CcmI [unclassified Roseitalea]|uniref:c-type cytochrome biogenesis protein CcmI n=1 Tax=unclassified Roseitalea TaxID=2639107 RepID=UPI00273DCC94|nr:MULTISPECIES: c-type cytochrome biogenesis protein CcmI [unclassified Roseitalea]
MVFWLTVAALTLATVLIGFRPLFAARQDEAGDRREDHEHDIAVYRHQLQEVDAEEARGAISKTEAAQARNEVARRILAVEDRMKASGAAPGDSARKRGGRAMLALFALVFVPGLSLIVYTGLGSPDYPSQPLAARLQAIEDAELASAETQDRLRALVVRAEDHLRDNPDDGAGWDVLAPVYFRLGEVGKSETAYRNAIRLMGESPARLSGLGEVLVTASGGMVTAEAYRLFERALAAEPGEPRARFFAGLADVQLGRYDGARGHWSALAEDEQAAPAWRMVASQQLARLEETAPALAEQGRPPQLDRQTVEQMQELDAQEQGAVIETMVASLDERLRAQPDDLEGWKRLIRARIVLDQEDGLRDALERAHDVYKDRPEALDSLAEFTSGLGLDVEEFWQ